MGLFKRKPPVVDEGPTCPKCQERLPEGALACAMCGHDLHARANREDQRVATARSRDTVA